MFLKAQFVLFLPKASPHAHVALKMKHASLKNTRFAVINFSETLSIIPCAAGSVRAPPSSLDDPREGGGSAGSRGAAPIANLGVCPLFCPPYVPLVIPCRPGALFGLIPLLSGLQEVHEKAIFPKQANNDQKMTKNGFL